MLHSAERHLKTGSDPRTLPDFSALRDELSKLSHPARPDVNWQYVERLALNLFDTNGVELQTAAWFTLARTNLAGIQGFNEGIALLDALIRYQWSAMWPASAHARIEILSSLSKRLQQQIRTLSFHRVDLPALYQSEKLLSATGEALQRLDLHTAAGTDMLRQILQNAIVRLENSDAPSGLAETTRTDVTLPLRAENLVPEQNNSPRWVYVVNTQPMVDVEVRQKPTPRIAPGLAFLSGLLTAGVLSLVAFKFIPTLFSHPEEEAVMSSLTALPTSLPLPVADQLRHDSPAWLANSDSYAKTLKTRLDELITIPTNWPLQYGSQLVEQTRHLYPDTELSKTVSKDWQSKLAANSLPAASISGWYQGVTELQKLQDRLNQLDEKKGKYMTVSELKTAVFSISKSLNDSIPAEELIRQLQTSPVNQPVSRDLQNRADLQLRQLNNSYMLVTTRNRE